MSPGKKKKTKETLVIGVFSINFPYKTNSLLPAHTPLSLPSAKDGTQGLQHASQELYHWATLPALKLFI
jgi:hypothetical protein